MKTKKILIAVSVALVAFGFTKQDIPHGIIEEGGTKLRSVENNAYKANKDKLLSPGTKPS